MTIWMHIWYTIWHYLFWDGIIFICFHVVKMDKYDYNIIWYIGGMMWYQMIMLWCLCHRVFCILSLLEKDLPCLHLKAGGCKLHDLCFKSCNLKLLGTLNISHKDYTWKSFCSNEEGIFIANSRVARKSTTWATSKTESPELYNQYSIINNICNNADIFLSLDPSGTAVIETSGIWKATLETVCLNASSPAPSSRRRERRTSGSHDETSTMVQG